MATFEQLLRTYMPPEKKSADENSAVQKIILPSLSIEDARFLALLPELFKREGFKNERQFLVSLGYNHSLLYKIRQGIQSVPKKLISTCAEKFGLNVQYLLTGNGKVFLPLKPEEPLNEGIIGDFGNFVLLELPFIDQRAAASFKETFLESYQGWEMKQFIIASEVAHLKNLASLKVSGTSMEPSIKEGATLLIQKVEEANFIYENSAIYVVSYADYLVIKRIKENELLTKQQLTLYSDNPDAGSLTIKGEDLRAMWKVIRIIDSTVP